MAVKTTKIQYNQDVDFRGKADIEGKLTCGSDVEVDGKLQINSAKDLVTKDGTSIGGGGDVSLDKVNEFVNGNTVISLIDTVSNPWGGGYYTGIMSKIKGKTYQTSPFIFIGLEGTGTNLKPVALVADSLSASASKVEFHVGDYGEWGMVINHNGYTRYLSGEIYYQSYHLSFPTKSGTLALKTDIPDVSTKQATLYRHTIDIDAGGLGLHTYITALSEKNTVIDSVQDLVAVFGNTKLMATGMFGTDSETTAMLEVGTTMLDTYVHSGHGSKLSLSDWANYGPEQSRLVITDSVTAM